MPSNHASATARRPGLNRRSRLARRSTEPGWVVLPLRAFLGATFIYAGLQKLADKHFFDAKSPSSVQAQLHAYAHTSPIRAILTVAGHHAVLFGLLIALGELAVGIGALTGLWTRSAAVGGALLSASFLLSVSWHARPFYYGADIVFLVAWLPLVIVGSGGVLSLDARLHEEARTDLALPPSGAVSIEFAAVRRLCGAYNGGSCQLRHNRLCAPEPCPVLLAGPGLTPTAAATLNRRLFLQQARAGLALAVGGAAVGVVVAIVGRLVPSKASQTASLTPDAGLAPPSTNPPETTSPHRPATTTTPSAAQNNKPPGIAIGAASAVPAGGAARFDDPATGDPAYVLRSSSGSFRAFSAVCTHAGCTVNYYLANESFVCPCHGAEFSAASGAVLRGPAQSPLATIVIAEGSDGQLYVR